MREQRVVRRHVETGFLLRAEAENWQGRSWAPSRPAVHQGAPRDTR